MRQFVDAVSILLVLVVLSACGGSTATREPDVVIAPADLARALAEDREAALERYEGKVLELSGTVGDLVRPGGLNPTLGVVFESIDDRLAFDSGLSFVSFEPDDADAVEEFNGLSVGDRVTLHCRLERLNESGSLIKVGDCRLAE